MKITIFIGGLSGGGAERVMCNLANYLSNKGYDIDMLTMSDEPPTYMLSDSINRISLLTQMQRKSLFYNTYTRIIALRRYMKRTAVDCYIAVLPEIIILTLIFKHFTKAKIIAAERTNPTHISKWKQVLLRLVAKRADGWTFQIEEIKSWYENIIGNSKTKIIPNAINSDFNVPVYREDKKPYIVSSGRLTKEKNQSMLIKSFAQVVTKFPNYKLIIYGEGSYRERLEALVEESHLQNKVFLPGYCEDIVYRIQESMLFVFSSNYEGMPNSLIEAMALGLPCISTDCDGGGVRFLIKNMENGIIVPKGDVHKMTDSIEFLLNNNSIAKQLGDEARKIKDRLSPTLIYAEWENFICEVVKGI